MKILFEDAHIIAINKPHGLLVHRSPIARDATEFAIQKVRELCGQTVFPVHRLDRKTSGVLLFAKQQDILRDINRQFQEKSIDKEYLALVRGYTEDEFSLDYPLVQDALTHFSTLSKFEIPVALGRHLSSRYSLLKVIPMTGRMHQIRRHLAHLRHPIIGDRPHGCNKQNRLWKEQWNMTMMMLHAEKLAFDHPVTGERLVITAEKSAEFERALNMVKQQEISTTKQNTTL
jgi:tRNA pseudouridine65 synthase